MPSTMELAVIIMQTSFGVCCPQRQVTTRQERAPLVPKQDTSAGGRGCVYGEEESGYTGPHIPLKDQGNPRAQKEEVTDLRTHSRAEPTPAPLCLLLESSFWQSQALYMYDVTLHGSTFSF